MLAGGLLGLVALLGPAAGAVQAGSASAQSGGWASRWTDGLKDSSTITGDTARFSGTFVYARSKPWHISRVDLELTRTGGGGDYEAACKPYTAVQNYPYTGPPTTESTMPGGSPTIPPQDDVEEPQTQDFQFLVVPRCNGKYSAVAVATADYGDTTIGGEKSDPLTLSDVTVAIRPPPVIGLEATAGADRSVSLGWQPPAGYGAPTPGDDNSGAPPDFIGYKIERAIGDGAFVPISATLADTRTFVDKGVPANATSVRYRVLGVRYGADHTEAAAVFSADGPVKGVTLAGATTPAPGGTGGTGGGGGTVRVGGSASPGRSTATTEFDPGFGEFLPYDELGEGDVEPGAGEETELGADEAAGSVLQQFSDDPLQPGSLVIPIAVGMVLFVWALHLRFLTRQAAQAALPVVPVRAQPVPRAHGRHYRRA